MPCCRQQQEAKGLLFFYVHNEVLTTYLIISCNELCHCMKNVLSCELAGTCHFLEVQLLLTLLSHVTASLLLVFFFSIASQIGQGIAQWFIGMSFASHLSL